MAGQTFSAIYPAWITARSAECGERTRAARRPAGSLSPSSGAATDNVCVRSSAEQTAGDGTEQPVFTSRLSGRPLLDTDGAAIGRVRDVVIWPVAGNEPPRALGLVVALRRRE